MPRQAGFPRDESIAAALPLAWKRAAQASPAGREEETMMKKESGGAAPEQAGAGRELK